MRRSSELGQVYGRVLRRSLAVAVGLHLVLFLFWPTMRADPGAGWTARSLGEATEEATPVLVHVHFGHPAIGTRAGAYIRVDRELDADHVLALPRECIGSSRDRVLPATGRVRLQVGESGEAHLVELVESSGSDCLDAIIQGASRALRYAWLPNAAFPVPVEAVQEVTIMPAPMGNEGEAR